MLDLAFIREHADLVRRTIREKGDHADLDQVLALDTEHRKALAEFEVLRREQNCVSKEIAARKKRKEPAEDLLDRMRAVAEKVKSLETVAKEADEKLRRELVADPERPRRRRPLRPHRRGQHDRPHLGRAGQAPLQGPAALGGRGEARHH